MQSREEVAESQPAPTAQLGVFWAGAFVTAAIVLVFFSLYFNRFAGLRSGNGSFQGGMALLRGILPYRDYFTAGPPLNQVISAAVLATFGQTLLVIRAWGVFERVAIALLLYSWLTRFFRVEHAALASITALIVGAGDPSNALSSYGYEAIFFFLASGLVAFLAAEKGRSTGWLIASAVAAGLLAALSLGTKQTLGAGATAGIPLLAAIYLWRSANFQRAALFVVCFAAGWGLGVGAILLWLARAGVVGSFLQDAFKKGPSAKASHPSDFLVRGAHAAWTLHWGFLLACVGLAACWFALRDAGRVSGRDERPVLEQSAGVSWVAVLSVLALALGTFASYAGRWLLKGFDGFAIYFGFLGVVLLVGYYAWRLLRGELFEREMQFCFLAAVSFGIALMVALSWPASFDMVVPAFGVVMALALRGAQGGLRKTLYGVCALAIVAMTCQKLNQPHGFHEWMDEPVRWANTRSSLPELQGMLLPPKTAHMIDETARIIRDHSAPQDTIFVYPEFGILYTLTNRRYPTTTDSHNIDVVNDEYARSEAEKLLAARPAVLVYYPTPEWSLRADERLWRHGQRSGQRDLIAAVEQLAKQYRLAASFKIPPNASPIEVYVRP